MIVRKTGSILQQVQKDLSFHCMSLNGIIQRRDLWQSFNFTADNEEEDQEAAGEINMRKYRMMFLATHQYSFNWNTKRFVWIGLSVWCMMEQGMVNQSW